MREIFLLIFKGFSCFVFFKARYVKLLSLFRSEITFAGDMDCVFRFLYFSGGANSTKDI